MRTMPYRTTAIGLAIALAAGAVAWTSVNRSTPHDPAIVTAATTPSSTRWIVPGNSAPAPHAAEPGKPQQPHKPARRIENGPLGQKVVKLLSPLVPTGSTLRSTFDHPDLTAGTATYTTPDHNIIELTITRLKNPVPLFTLTLGSQTDALTELPTGTQIVEIRHGQPQWIQLVLARPSGTIATFTISTAIPGAKITTVAADLDRQLQLAKKALDSNELDALTT